MSTTSAAAVVVAGLGLLVSVMSLTLTTFRARIADVVAVSQRLTSLEKAGDALPKGLSERLASMEQRMASPERLAERLASLEQRITSPERLAERLAGLEQRASMPERLAERLAAMEQAVRSLPDSQPLINRLIAAETKIDLFWRGLSVDAARVLHSPHPEWARRDLLLEGFMAHRLSSAEAAELGEMLLEVFDNHEADPGQRMAAAVVLKFLHSEFRVDLHR